MSYGMKWQEDSSDFSIDTSEKKDEGNFIIKNESINTYIEFTPKTIFN